MENRIKCEVEGYEDKFFQVGQKWKTRGGDIVRIIELDYDDEDFCIMYNLDYDIWVTRAGRGSFGEKNLQDLVELIEDITQDSNKELEQETKIEATTTVNTNQVVKLSEFLKEHNAYDSFVEQSVEYWEEVIPDSLRISEAFSWKDSEEGEDYWRKLSNTFGKLPNKVYDMVDLVIKAKEGSNSETNIEDSNKESIPKTEYFVFVSGNKAPKVAHSTLASAEKEAIRLSEKEIGREVSIMTKVKSYKSEVIVKEILC